MTRHATDLSAPGGSDRKSSTSFGLIASVFLAIAAIIYAGLLLMLLFALLRSAPAAWQDMPMVRFLATAAAIVCASAGLFFLATVPFRAVAHFWAVGGAFSRGEAPRKMPQRMIYGLVAVAVIFALASLSPVFDGEYARQPWISIAFQMLLLGAPAVLALIVLRAEAVMRRQALQRKGAEAE